MRSSRRKWRRSRAAIVCSSKIFRWVSKCIILKWRRDSGGQLARSAGAYAEVLANADGYTDLKIKSGEVRRVLWTCLASLGQVSNSEWSLVNFGKAGRSRWMGIRPTVRGSAMNPVDHPYGGGEGAQPRGTRKPKTMWGKVTGGHKTRNKKKQSSKFIVKRRIGLRNRNNK